MISKRKQKIDNITGKSNLWKGKHIYFDEKNSKYMYVNPYIKNTGFGCSKLWIGEHIIIK